ncbi:MAG: DMT family transporter [Spirochaetales bacterium]|nr:DMT family transporter [Spirochaetales bacterium]
MKKGYLYIFFTTILFSTMEIALKTIVGVFNPIQINIIRFGIGGLFLLPFAIRALKNKEQKLKVNDFLFFSLTGFIGIIVSMTFYQLAIVVSKASIVAIIFSCNAVFVIPFAFLILKEKIEPHIIISTLISLSGIVAIMNPFNLSWSFMTGIILALIAAVMFALYGVIGKTRSSTYGGLVTTCFSFIMATIEMLILITLSHVPTIANLLISSDFGIFANIPIIKGIALSNIPTLAYVSFFVTGLGYTFYFLAIERTSASLAALVFYIKPALAPILALLILKEDITQNTLVGICFIVIGSTIAFIGNTKSSTKVKV